MPRNDIEKAVFYFYIQAYSFASGGDGFSAPKPRGKSSPIKNIWRDYSVWSNRLKKVCIENKSYDELISIYDDENSLFYCDPPYVGTENYYKTKEKFDIEHHKNLANILSNIKGKFILSYNDCELVRELYKDFHIKQTKEIRYTLNAKVDNKARELFITNFEQRTLNDSIQLLHD